MHCLIQNEDAVIQLDELSNISKIIYPIFYNFNTSI